MEFNLVQLASVDTVVAGIKGNYDIVLDTIWNERGQSMQLIASENNLWFPREMTSEKRE